MRSTVTVLILSLAFGFEALAQSRRTPPDKPVEAVVIEITGTALFREGPTAPIQKLTKKNALGKQLHAGDELLVEGNGELKLKVFRKDEPEVITPGLGWYPIPAGTVIITPNPTRGIYLGQTRIAGRRRGVQSTILSPQRYGVVRPQGIVFRWVPFKERSFLDLSLKLERDNKDLWSQNKVEGTSGELTSEIARKSLRKIQKRSVSRYVEFVLVPEIGKPQRVLFRVISLEEEEALAKELTKWDSLSGFVRNMHRAYNFSRRRLYDEAAGEYESALADSPESPDLLQATIRAYCRAGNRIRAEELAKRLSPGQVLLNCTLVPTK